MRKPCVSLIIQFKEQSFHVKVDLCDEKHWEGFLCQKETENIFQIQILVTFAARLPFGFMIRVPSEA